MPSQQQHFSQLTICQSSLCSIFEKKSVFFISAVMNNCNRLFNHIFFPSLDLSMKLVKFVLRTDTSSPDSMHFSFIRLGSCLDKHFSDMQYPHNDDVDEEFFSPKNNSNISQNNLINFTVLRISQSDEYQNRINWF